MSIMLRDLLTTYKLGWKTSYYQNTYDFKTDPSEVEEETKTFTPLAEAALTEETEECESCVI